MKILMIAPEPYFEPRGTPFSEYFRIKALCRQGHSIDLITYPIGHDRPIPGLTVIRSWRPPGVRFVKTGPSLAKVFLDIFLFLRVLGRVIRHRYDWVHTHEEGCIMGVAVSKLARIPHLYDMHSSLVQQMDNFQFSRSRLLLSLFRWMEKTSLRNARSVIVICRSLFDYAAEMVPASKLTMIENFLDETPDDMDEKALDEWRLRFNPNRHKLIVYTGTFERYQGIPLLLDALARLEPEYRLLLVGGRQDQVDEIRRKALDLGVESRVVLVGQRPAEEIPLFLRIADVLVSPRILGTNIPLKIYSYLKSGVPVVATCLPTHTQTLTPEISVLAEPDVVGFSRGIRRAAGPEGIEIARRAMDFCRLHFTEERYGQLVNEAVTKVLPPPSNPSR